jgi:hypothetical protein
VIPKEYAAIGSQKVMLMTFFSSVSLITLNALPSGEQLNQEYFMSNILLVIFETRWQIVH